MVPVVDDLIRIAFTGVEQGIQNGGPSCWAHGGESYYRSNLGVGQKFWLFGKEYVVVTNDNVQNDPDNPEKGQVHYFAYELVK